MKITVRFIGILERITGQDTLTVDLPEGATYGYLQRELGGRFGRDFPEDIWDNNAQLFKGAVLVVGEGRDLEDPDTRLRQGEEIWVLMPIAGG